MVNFHSYFMFATHFHWIVTKFVFTFPLICPLCMEFTHNIYIIARNHTNLYNL